jgi:protein-disulfide isomerase
MNTKRLIFWSGFLIILALIIWGLFVSMNRSAGNLPALGAPAPVTAADHSEGPATARVTLIEYGDFECPACADYAPLVEQLASDEATGTLRIVFRQFPLQQHPNALITAQASEAASDQGKFWDMYKLIYAGQPSWQDQSIADIRVTLAGYASTLGLDKTRFSADLDSTTTAQFIQSELSEGVALGISYTPTFFVNGKLIQNPQSYEAFKALIDAAAR